MSYINFDKSQLINLEYSLSKEILRSNRAGSFASTTLVGCNTRKYHGLLICPVENLDGEKHVLLSGVDETIIDHKSEFDLGIHKYQGDIYYPRGHKYIRDYEVDLVPKTVYRVGNTILIKESLLVENEQQMLLKYTLQTNNTSIRFRIRPFLAFRNIHSLSKANLYANTKVKYVANGISSKLYQGYPNLFLQVSKYAEYIHAPDWYYNIEYLREMERGYAYQEDLFVPGYFELTLKNNESIIFSASTIEINPTTLKRKFDSQAQKRIRRDSFKNCLINSAQQFIAKKDKKTEIIAGFPWFGTWGRDTFISLPGLTLTQDDVKTFRAVIDTTIKKLKNGLFPNTGPDKNPEYNSADAPLWFFWSLQQLADYLGSTDEIWKNYSKYLKSILNGYKKGLDFNIKMHDNGLVFAGEQGKALTWMDAISNGKPVTPRIGFTVEINALWYNAIMFALEMAQNANDTSFVKQWEKMPEKIQKSFINVFWDDDKQYLADYVYEDYTDWSVRPNMLFATSLKYSPIDNEKMKAILDIVKDELLTPKGIRSLSPKNPLYKGFYEGNQVERDHAYHQGSAWPWLLEHFSIGYLRIFKNTGVELIRKINEAFEEEMSNHGIGTISEIYDGNPPHHPRGSISQAWSVSALLSIGKLLEKY